MAPFEPKTLALSLRNHWHKSNRVSHVETHQFIIQLFRYLNKKYFTGFKLIDEGEYWETNDETLLKKNFKRNADLINSFVSAHENFPILPGETTEEYLERLIKTIADKRKKGE